jgi:rhodanese-related sulfurtransferase
MIPNLNTMTLILRLTLLFLFLSLYSRAQTKGNSGKTIFQCMPCGYDCDKTPYDKPGKCPHCQMDLVDTRTITFKSISPEAICDHIRKHPDVILLDVRTKEEFEGKADPDFGSLKNAVNIPVQELGSRLPSLSKWKGRDIIVYCSHSHRSPRASWMLANNGFKKVTNMEGGMSVMKDRSCVR